MQTNMSMEYFAALEDPDRLAQEMIRKITLWREWCSGNGFMGLWQRKLKNYYGISDSNNTSMAVTAGGSEGELALIKVNDLHNLIQNQLVIVTSQRPAGIAKASKPDTKSLRSSRIGTALAEYYMSRPQLGYEKKFVKAAEMALLLDESDLELFWDKTAGDAVALDPITGEQEFSGDCILRLHPPYFSARDAGQTVDEQNWRIYTYKVNKFSAAATYPKFREAILAAGEDSIPGIPFDKIPDGSDMIWAHLLVHDKSAAVKGGRYALMIAQKIVLDSKLPFPTYPCERLTSSDVIDGVIGYSNANDILAMEQVTDALHSVVVTNQTTFGGQCLKGPEGGNIKQSDFGKGVRYFEMPPDMIDKFQPMDLLRTPPEIFNYLSILDNKKQQQVGVNSVVRGQPEGQLAGASGAALALIQAQAISFNSGTQRSYFSCLSSVMTKLIEILRVYADTPRIGEIVGKAKAQHLKQFVYTGEDLNSVSSVVYEMINPVMQTQGGRMTLADNLLERNQIKNPKQYLNLVLTGQLDTLTEDDESDDMLILEENEALIEGRPVMARITEQHMDHIKSHSSLISQEAKESDPDLVDRVQSHVLEHINLWMQATMQNPAILFATGQQPLPMPQMAPPPAPSGAGGGPEMMNPQPPAIQQAQEVNQPNLPNIAGTNEKPQVPGVNQ